MFPAPIAIVKVIAHQGENQIQKKIAMAFRIPLPRAPIAAADLTLLPMHYVSENDKYTYYERSYAKGDTFSRKRRPAR